MATDLSTTGNQPASKATVGAVFPAQVSQSQSVHLEPLITPEQLVTRHLFGIPLVSGVKNPLTGRADVMTAEKLKDIIEGAVTQAEVESHLDIMPVQRVEKHAWDRNDYLSFGYFRLEHRPCSALQEIAVSPPDNSTIFIVPLQWIEVARLAYGQVNIIPLLVAMTSGGGVVTSTPAGASVFLAIFSDRTWLPDFWRVTYTSGFPDGKMPRIVNELIGTIAAMEVLSQLAATYAHATGTSLGIDGLSQSVSGPGPQRYQQRMTELVDKRKKIARKIRVMYGQSIFSGQV